MKQTRRTFLASSASILSAAALPAARPQAGRAPNILLCISDDQSWLHTGAGGDPVVRTPGFDRVASEGVLFTQAFCDAPTCGPSRSALLTGQPFCFWLGSYDPHRPYTAGSGQESGKDPAKVDVPPHLPDHPIVRDDILDYYVEVERFDGTVEAALGLLEQAGQLENTLVVVTSDHGMPFPRAKASLYDYGSRVPLAVRWGDAIPGGRVVDDFVSLSDLAPTFLEAAGLEPAAEMTAGSLLPLLTSSAGGRVEPDRDAAFIAMERHDGCRRGGKGYPCRAIRTESHLYIRNFEPTRWPSGSPNAKDCARGIPYGEIDSSPTKTLMMESRDEPEIDHLAELSFGTRPEHELYDLRSDPGQLNNLASDVASQPVLEQLRDRLMDHLAATGDPRALGLPAPWDYYPYYGRRVNENWEVDAPPG